MTRRMWWVRWVVLTLVCVIPLGVSAEFNEVSLETGTILKFPGNGFDYVVQGGTRGIQSLGINDTDNRFELGVTANSIFIITNENKSGYTVTGSSCNSATIECSSSQSTLTIYCNNGPSDHTIYIVPGGANTCSGASSGGGGGGGGGGAPPPPPPPPSAATPATPATPAVPGVSPAIPATPAKPPSTAAGYYFKSRMARGSSGDEVKQLQFKLQELGHFSKNITANGFFGAVTEDSVRKFQKANGLAQVGFVGPGTRAALNSGVVALSAPAAPAPPPAPAPAPTPAPPPAPAAGVFKSFLNVGSRNDEVKALQVKLQALGFLAKDVTPTGYFGNLTAEAVKKFQAANGISPVGFVGPATRAALNK